MPCIIKIPCFRILQMQARHCIELQGNMRRRWLSIKSYCFNTNISKPFLNIFKLSIQLNKSIRFVGQAEENPMKKELLRCVDKIPAYCHQLMFTSRSLAVGQAACCRKVSDVGCAEIIVFPSLYLKSDVTSKHSERARANSTTQHVHNVSKCVYYQQRK